MLFAIVNGMYQVRPSGIGSNDSGEIVQVVRVPPVSRGLLRIHEGTFTYLELLAFRKESTSFLDVAASTGFSSATIRVGDRVTAHRAGLSSSNYLRTLGVQPLVGRGFTEEEERQGSDPVCIISQRLARGWGLEQTVPGAIITANGHAVTVVGILPDAFGGTNYADRAEMWFPLGQHEILCPGCDALSQKSPRAAFQLMGRLRPGVTRQRSEAELTTILRRHANDHPDTAVGATVQVAPLLAYGHIERFQLVPLYVVLGLATTLLLTMTIANVAALWMVLAIRRQRDVAIRLSVGASPGRILAERLSEGLAMGILAGALGLALATGLLKVLGSTVVYPKFQRLVESASILSWKMPAFVVAVCMLAVLASGFFPAWSAGRTDPMLVLKGSDWTRHRRMRGRTGALVGQTAVVTVLALLGAASARSLWRAATTSPGLDTRDLVVASVKPAASGYDMPRSLHFARRLLDELNSPAPFQSATLSRLPPINRSPVSDRVGIVNPYEKGSRPLGQISYDEVAPNYFAVLGIPVVAGRAFQESDTESSPPVIILNSYAARQWSWPEGGPLGRVVQFAGIPHTIVGVVGDVRNRGSLLPHAPFAYVPLFQRASRSSTLDMFGFTINLRSHGTLGSAGATIRRAVRGLDRELAVSTPKPIDALVRETLSLEGMLRDLSSAFAALALVVCVVGYYATALHMSKEREREYGIRMALGARPVDVVLLVVKGWLITIGTGLGIGTICGVALASVVARTQAATLIIDEVVLGSVCALMVTVSLAAVCVPLWRAVSKVPATTLRLPSETQ